MVHVLLEHTTYDTKLFAWTQQVADSERSGGVMLAHLHSTLQLSSSICIDINSQNSSSSTQLAHLARLIDAVSAAASSSSSSSSALNDRSSVTAAARAVYHELSLLLELSVRVRHSPAVLVLATLMREDRAAVGTLRACSEAVEVHYTYTLIHTTYARSVCCCDS